jgi:Inner membrane protein YgaP-like, transmembrane domain
LRRIDTQREDEAMIEVVAQALETRWPQSRRRGGWARRVEVVIRMLILKHLFDWSYDDLEDEVRANLVYRAFSLAPSFPRARPGELRADRGRPLSFVTAAAASRDESSRVATMVRCAIRYTPTQGAEIRYEEGSLEDNMPFVAFMRAIVGRLLRVAFGGAIMWYGFAQLQGAVGTAVGLVGIVPIAAGFFNFCLLGPLFGLGLMGQPTARALR